MLDRTDVHLRSLRDQVEQKQAANPYEVAAEPTGKPDRVAYRGACQASSPGRDQHHHRGHRVQPATRAGQPRLRDGGAAHRPTAEGPAYGRRIESERERRTVETQDPFGTSDSISALMLRRVRSSRAGLIGLVLPGISMPIVSRVPRSPLGSIRIRPRISTGPSWITTPNARSGSYSTTSIVPDRLAVVGVAAADHRPHADWSLGQLLQLHVRIPARVILYVLDRMEAEHIRQWPVDHLADVKLHRFSWLRPHLPTLF